MIFLDTTSKTLCLILRGVVSTNQLPYVCSWNDLNTSIFQPGTTDGTSDDTNEVTVMPSPAAGIQRQLKYLSVYNADTAQATVDIQLYDGTNYRIVFSAILLPGYTLNFVNDEGFRVFDTYGALISNSNTMILTNDYFWIGNAANVATQVQMSGDGTLANTGALTIANNAITYGKMQKASTVTLLGNPTGGTADIQEITLGTGLSFAGSVLNASGTAYTADETTLHLSGTVFSIKSTYVGQASITTLGTITTGTWGTGAVIAGCTMTLGSDAAYDMYYRNSSGVLTRLGNGTTGQVITATTGAAPSWQAAAGSITGSGSQYQVTLWTGTSSIGGLTNGAAGTILQSNGTGANPSWVSALANGTTATTQSVGDNSTKVATTAFVLANAGGSTTPQTLTDSSAITWNINSGGNAYLLMTTAVGATRTLTISNPVAGQNYTLVIKQASTGGQAMTFTGITVLVAGAGGGAVTLSVANNAYDVLQLYYDGTQYYCTYANSFT